MARRVILAFTFVAVPLATALGAMQAARGRSTDQVRSTPRTAPEAKAVSQSGLDLSGLNRAIDPCTDFYQFACGGWIAGHPIPADQARWGTFDALQERNHETLRTILEAASAKPDPSTRKIGDYYASCMDERTIDDNGVTPLERSLKSIDALKTTAELPALLASLHTIGVPAFFTLQALSDFKDAKSVIATIDQGGLGLPDRDYYFRADSRSGDIRGQYTDHVAKLVALAGTPPASTTAFAASVMRAETTLAKTALDNVSRRDPSKLYHKMSVAELQKLTPRFNWTEYFRVAGIPAIETINVTEPEFFKGFDQLLGNASLDDIKMYLRWHLVHANAFLLAAPFVDENFRFYSGALQGISQQRPRWKRCVQYTDNDLGEALGQAFVAAAFGPQAKADMLEMVKQVEHALERDINTLSWMTDSTRKQALGKLRAVSNKIGYPDKWRDYGPLQIVRGDALGNSHRANAFNFRREMNKIGKPLDKSEWTMTPPTVNAYYNPSENNINFPAGILQPPFFSDAADPAVNYGGAGAVIGHELTHGFDDQGRQFDADGNLQDWWTAADARAFEQRAQCFVDQYSGFTAVDDVKLNGKLTLGENTADNGGLRIALMAYLGSDAAKSATVADGFTPEQRVFLGWAQVWCEGRRPEYERLQAQTNPHSPGRYRVNGVMSNMPEFQKAFGCSATSPMVSQRACRVW